MVTVAYIVQRQSEGSDIWVDYADAGESEHDAVQRLEWYRQAAQHNVFPAKWCLMKRVTTTTEEVVA